MANNTRATLLGSLLKGVSRSFYLSLRVLPLGMRDPVALAYLLARAADTIADTSLISPDKRLDMLLSLRRQINGVPDFEVLQQIALEVAGQQRNSDEKVLLQSLKPAVNLLGEFDEFDRRAIRQIVTTLTEGMEFDLHTFPDESSDRIVALEKISDLDRYTYLIAGCVGEFWTQMSYAHVRLTTRDDEPTMMEQGIRLGKALQMTNILRDCSKDLRIGRCYLPASNLGRHGLTPQGLLLPDNSLRARPVLFELVHYSLEHYREGLKYVLSLPVSRPRLRLASLWPILIGLETLLLLVQNEHWLDPSRPSKVRRSDVRRILGRSLLVVSSDRRLRLWVTRLIADIEGSIGSRMEVSWLSLIL